MNRNLHNLVITYAAKNIFTGKVETYRENLRLNWEGVRKMVADPYYKVHGATFELHPFWGQPTDN